MTSNEEYCEWYENFFEKNTNSNENSDDLVINEITFFRDDLFSMENLFRFGLFSIIVLSPFLFNRYPSIAKTMDDIIQKKAAETITNPNLSSIPTNSELVGKIIDYRPKKIVKPVKVLDDLISFTKLTKLLKKLEKNTVLPLLTIKEKFPIPLVTLITEEIIQPKITKQVLVIQALANFSETLLLFKTLSIIRGGFDNTKMIFEEQSFLERSKGNFESIKIESKKRFIQLYLYFKKNPRKLISVFFGILVLSLLFFYSKSFEITFIKDFLKPENLLNVKQKNPKLTKVTENTTRVCKPGVCPSLPDRQLPNIYQKMQGFDPDTQTPNRKFIQGLLKLSEEKMKIPAKKYFGKKRK